MIGPKERGSLMQEQQQKQLTFRQKLQVAIPLVKLILRAARQDSTAFQIEKMLVKGLKQLGIPAQSAQMFKDRLEQARQSQPHAHLEDIYVMGGILIYCGILLQVLMSLGIPDLPARFAWITFAVSFPCTVGFFLALFLKKKNNISSPGGLHSKLAFVAEIGAVATTACLFFHVWSIAGWAFLLCTLTIFLGYYSYRFGIYYRPFLSIFVI
jgi:UDP-N-acetylmuramyl pentapeptide phosphotransferase/UDP-N-acetylglucosamine-1-phosphate transferase